MVNQNAHFYKAHQKKKKKDPMFLTPLLSSVSVKLFIGGTWKGAVDFEGLLQVKSYISSKIQVYPEFPTIVVSSYSLYFKANVTNNTAFCIPCTLSKYVYSEIISPILTHSAKLARKIKPSWSNNPEQRDWLTYWWFPEPSKKEPYCYYTTCNCKARPRAPKDGNLGQNFSSS